MPALMETASVKVTRPLFRNTAVGPQINYIYRISFPHQSPPPRPAALSREMGVATARSTFTRQRRLTEQSLWHRHGRRAIKVLNDSGGAQCLSSQFNHGPTPPLSPAHSINKPFLTFAQDVTLPTSPPAPLRFFTLMRSFTSHLRLISHRLLAIKPLQPPSINSQGYGFERDCCPIKTLRSESQQSSCAL